MPTSRPADLDVAGEGGAPHPAIEPPLDPGSGLGAAPAVIGARSAAAALRGVAVLPEPTVDAEAAELAERDDVDEQRREYRRAARAASTHAAYNRDLARFQRWCDDRGLDALPADAATIERWLLDQAPAWRPATAEDPLEVVVEGKVQTRAGLRPATIARRLAAVAAAHRTRGLANPTADPGVRETLAGIRRHPGVAPRRRRAAARTEQIHAAVDGLDPEADAADARDLALILIGFAAALRRSDLARLDLDDLTSTEDGLEVRIRRSKTDQYGTGAVVGIAADPDGACPPAAAWALWRAHLARIGVTAGAAWRPIHRSRQDTLTVRPVRLTGKAINDIVARRAAQAGLDGDYGSHSLRRGFATEALANGAATHDVMRHGRWRSMTTMLGYADDAARFADTNPTRRLGLSKPTEKPMSAALAPTGENAQPGSRRAL